ncbi:MFS transporter [Helicobacter cetorum]|uniref:Multidrug-efflux transporter n=1 Tax=Helicobacter cetorum (strain ATCC BAA-540 / CCUG 52418 / MIT 99-5656) TaxID=1163745 RepID=I0ERK2_HELCM|nr:MFS transporter [Helicobacter cetorum]AFI05571.1 multidrug-efflux transporter [Helicobacter cetorum MIT 99-5656]
MFKKIFPLALVSSLRFLGLFIVLPVISLYADSFHTSSPLLIGLAVGGAYLTQIIFQTPIGILSDKIGRKIVVSLCLLVFLAGSLVCFMASDITMLVIGRLIQGMGALGGVVSAMVADEVREEERTKAMAIMGAFIFISFTISMAIGPGVVAFFGNAKWLFLLTAILALFSLVMLLKVKDSPKISYTIKAKLSQTQNTKALYLLHLSSFFEKMFMTLIFVLIPLALVNEFNKHESFLISVYVPGAILGILSMGPASVIAEKYNKPKGVMLFGVLFFVVSYLCLFLADSSFLGKHLWLFILGVMFFFSGFATLEPIMQSLASKFARANEKGKVLGQFTTFGYLGSFVGGVSGGLSYHHLGLATTSLMVVILGVIWGLLLFLLNNPAKQKNVYFPLDAYIEEKFEALETRIIEWYVNTSEEIIIVKYDSSEISEEEIIHLAQNFRK